MSTSSEYPQDRIAELERRLEEAEETIRAIRSGEVDALVVAGDEGDQVFTLQGADHPYRVLVQEMREGTVNLDENGAILYSNQQFARMLNVPLQSVIGSGMAAFIAEEDRPLFAALLEAAKTDKSRGEVRLVARPVNAPAYLSMTSVHVSDLHTIAVVITDLTEQKRHEAVLASEQLSRSILENAADPIVVFDLDLEILRASQTAHTLAGTNVMRRKFDAVFPLQMSDEPGLSAADLLAECREHNSVKRMEATLRRPNGQDAELLVSAAGLWDGEGKPLGCVVTLTDITDRKRAEDELARQAQELARSNADLQNFAYVTSHDLQEPLRTIVSFSQMLTRRYRDRLDREADEFLDYIVSGAQRMKGLIDSLLAYSRVVNVETLPFTPVPLDAAIHWAEMNLQAIIGETRTSVIYQGLPTVRADHVQLVQLFQNLLGNAIKYRKPDETPQIQITAERKGDEWVISVRDNGIGISPEYAESIFGVFKRLHGKEIPGTGIGLAICKRIVQKHEGRIWVESEAGKGATFRFTLPA